MPHGFSGDKQVIKFEKMLSLFILDNRTWRTFHHKEVNYGCVSDHIVSFLDTAVTIDVFTIMQNDAVKLVET